MANAFTPRSTDPGKRFLSLTCLLEVFFASSILFSEWRWSKSRRSLSRKNTSCGVSYVLFWMWEDKTSCVKSKKYLNHRRNLPAIKLSLLPRELGEVSECYRHSRKLACCNKFVAILKQTCYQQADIKMRSHGLRQLVHDKYGRSEYWADILKLVGSILTVVRHIFLFNSAFYF